jgi:hypothetical protein
MGWMTRIQFQVGTMMGDFFSLSLHPDQTWGPPNFLSSGYRGALTPGLKQPEREDDHLHLLLRSRKCLAIPPLLQYVFMV